MPSRRRVLAAAALTVPAVGCLSDGGPRTPETVRIENATDRRVSVAFRVTLGTDQVVAQGDYDLRAAGTVEFGLDAPGTGTYRVSVDVDGESAGSTAWELSERGETFGVTVRESGVAFTDP